MAITDIYRIKTRNSIYEIQVRDHEGHSVRPSRCRKEGEARWRQVSDMSGTYLDKLCIGPGFLIPGVVDTSNVADYVHFVLSPEPKRRARQGSATGIPEFFAGLADHVVEQVHGGPVLIEKKGCDQPGCTYSSNSGPTHDGSRMCKSGSIASGGTRAHCACDFCF